MPSKPRPKSKKGAAPVKNVKPLPKAKAQPTPPAGKPKKAKPQTAGTCVACGGKGKNSRGRQCVPCKGTGKQVVKESLKPKYDPKDVTNVTELAEYLPDAPVASVKPKAAAKKSVPAASVISEKDQQVLLDYDAKLADLFALELPKIQKLIDEWDSKIEAGFTSKAEAQTLAQQIKARVKTIYDNL